MKRWQVLTLLSALAAAAIIVASAWLPEANWPWTPWGMHNMPHGRWLLAAAERRTPLENAGAQLASLLSHFVVGMLVLYLAPRRMRHMAEALDRSAGHWLRYLAAGALLAVSLAGVALLSALSVYTFPLPFIVLALFFLAALVGSVAVAYQVGRTLMQRSGWGGGRPLLNLGLGTLLVFALSRLPVVGWAALILVWLVGSGVAVATRFGSGRRWTLKPLMEDDLP